MSLALEFIDKFNQLLGDEAADFFAALNKGEAQKAFRINPLKAKAQAICQSYFAEELTPCPYSPWGYLGQVDGNSPLHQAGLVYSQEASAMAVASVVQAQPGEKILDLCAAPGGKSTQIAADMQGQGLLVANEIIPKRAKILAENIERMGISNALVTNHDPESLAAHFPGFFDKILVDAPCSGEGMFTKSQAAREGWSKETPLLCQERQKEILSQAVRMLKAGGQLIYSTCTFSPEENEEVIAWLLDQADFDLEWIDQFPAETISRGRSDWSQSDYDLSACVRIWPHRSIGEGHFIARLKAKDSLNTDQVVPKAKKKRPKKGKKQTHKAKASPYRLLEPEERINLAALTQSFPNEDYQDREVIAKGDQVWLLPPGVTYQMLVEGPLNQLHSLRLGLHLGSLLKNRFQPSYAWAMALAPKATYPQIEISYDDWVNYVQGLTLAYPGNQGWVLLDYQGMVISFGKQVQGTVKNFFPKGLRFHPWQWEVRGASAILGAKNRILTKEDDLLD